MSTYHAPGKVVRTPVLSLGSAPAYRVVLPSPLPRDEVMLLEDDGTVTTGNHPGDFVPTSSPPAMLRAAIYAAVAEDTYGQPVEAVGEAYAGDLAAIRSAVALRRDGGEP